MPININVVKKIMLEKGIAPSDLARKMKISKSRVSRILNTEVSNSQVKTIHSLATALDVNPTEILKEE
ncbi:helix-turn-helix transcriptional regulator [Clostridium botulinum]|uniref:Helix-turn-helix transcriptional regulator n=1 Tax=Clostridium botulinum TaxID=1491 RepID=A0A6B4HT68_CLOBO|nr:helix-turn-helix transcriptional regulator [Clostridium botulinum]EES48251.1 conserved domain protein [Clostridium botulinum E1 str. 'BoNT E Beluga']MBY6760673.1 helix-turn-helix transcriptional regulator [Clostridium botulinum]MBY6915371.1 helix-turn-helix transcriptional regulator [Clostridium botulinum]MBY6919580.1 helix-turn-helix transcriptional regulator [Clostridium botulinum]MBY6948381.1 helix-turn-helix transcriptional regulator [Clostridium botulinum]